MCVLRRVDSSLLPPDAPCRHRTTRRFPCPHHLPIQIKLHAPPAADPADVAAGFFGGVLSTGVAALGVSLFQRVRYGHTYSPPRDTSSAMAAWA